MNSFYLDDINNDIDKLFEIYFSSQNGLKIHKFYFNSDNIRKTNFKIQHQFIQFKRYLL